MASIKRYPRERFTLSLASLCERLDKKHRLEFDYRSPRGSFLSIYGRVRVDVRVLWVFGSWARGALECGDLDVAVDLHDEWAGGHGWCAGGRAVQALPGFEIARRAVLRAPPLIHILNAGDIRKYGPTGDFAVHPDTMMPIWLAPDLSSKEKTKFGVADFPHLHWSERIAAIKGDPSFRRAPRTCDALPLQVEQTAMSLREAESAVFARDQGLITWEFLPHGKHRDDEAELTRAERELVPWHRTHDRAQITRVIAATRELRQQHRKPLFWYGNRCSIWHGMHEAWQSNCIVITPRWSAQGPNGSLVVTRGKLHSLEQTKAFDKDLGRNRS